MQFIANVSKNMSRLTIRIKINSGQFCCYEIFYFDIIQLILRSLPNMKDHREIFKKHITLYYLGKEFCKASLEPEALRLENERQVIIIVNDRIK